MVNYQDSKPEFNPGNQLIQNTVAMCPRELDLVSKCDSLCKNEERKSEVYAQKLGLHKLLLLLAHQHLPMVTYGI